MDIQDNGWKDDDDDELVDDDWNTGDWEDDDEAEVLPCPNCGTEIFEDADQCPVCGSYVTFSTSLWSGRSPIWVLLGIVGIIAVIFALLLT